MTTLTDGRLKTIWQSCGVPKKLKNATLSNYTPNNQNQAQALKKCTEYTASGLENIKQGEGLFFFGPVGTGKTHLAVATVQAIISKNQNNSATEMIAPFTAKITYKIQQANTSLLSV